MLTNYGNKYATFEKSNVLNYTNERNKKTKQVSYVENRTLNMIEIVNNIVSIIFDLQRQDVKVPLHLSTIGMATILFRNRD